MSFEFESYEAYYEEGGPSGSSGSSGPPRALSVLAEHWGLVLAYGLVSLGLGITLAVWPGETLKVVAILVGIQFLVSGLVRVVGAIAATSLDTSVRVLLGVTGAIAFIVGLLCLRDPLQTLLVIWLILGVWWVVSGIIDIVGALVAPAPGRRAWEVTGGVISVVAGAFLLIDPHLTLGVLVFVVCAWLIVTGGLAVFSAFRLRSQRRSAVGRRSASSPPPAPAV
jgi:uncharacterized membrane protein HdeD (DUF308 family)